jgi:hypothetical protein
MRRNLHGHGFIEEALQVSFVCVCCECFQEDCSAVSDLTECTVEQSRGEEMSRGGVSRADEGWARKEYEEIIEFTEDIGEG